MIDLREYEIARWCWNEQVDEEAGREEFFCAAVSSACEHW